MSKFTWEPLAGGSLLLRISNESRETTWRIKKTAKIEDVQRIFEEIVGTLALKTPQLAKPWDKDYRPEILGESVWLSDIDSATTEEESKAALAAKADGLRLGANWFNAGPDDASDLPFMAPNAKKDE